MVISRTVEATYLAALPNPGVWSVWIRSLSIVFGSPRIRISLPVCADHPIDQDTAQGDPFATYMYTIFLPEVAVNTETGKVKVEKFTCVADVGTIMNRLLVEGNFYGGLVQGIGLALTEDFEDLNHDTSLKNCGIPYPNDAPDDIELHFNETYRPSGPYGAAGCGEAPLDAPHPAILNAIYNATGARITRVPARPEKVLAALKELEK